MATTRAATPANTPEKDKNRQDINGERKEILDPVHGSMDFHPVLVKIMDTPEFQRLRDIKQLGGTCYVYPGGVHTRFDHSLGTAFLCQKHMRILKERYSWISDKDILCVCIAGLCHNLGHGPFSYVYQNQFLLGMKGEEWNHNSASVKIFDKIAETEKVKKIFERSKIGNPEKDFIKAAMQGKVPQDKTDNRYLYEIVKNRRNGVDCSTIDSVLRDGYFLGHKHNFNYERYFQSSRITEVKKERTLCVRYKLQFQLYELFYALWSLKHCVYFHKTTRIIEMMLAEALAKVDTLYGISEARDDPEKLSTMSDSLIYKIMNERDCREVADAQHILRRIQKRDLYQFCGQTNVKKKQDMSRKSSLTEKNQPERSPDSLKNYRDKVKFAEEIAKGIAGLTKRLREDDIFIDIVDIVYGIGNGNPLENMHFVNKEGQLVKPEMKESISEQLPVTFKDQYIRAYARERKNKDEVIARFYDWCIENDHDIPEDMEKGKIAVEHEDCSVARTLSFGD